MAGSLDRGRADEAADDPGPDAAPAADHPGPSGRGEDDPGADTALVEDDLLIEEISIDGMCGVY